MGRLSEQINILEKALYTLEEIIMMPYDKVVRDASIQRFEYSFEIFWKTAKVYLYEHHGIVCNSPKMCFKELFALGLCSEMQTVALLEMTDSRNLTSHTYHEEIAETIYRKIPEYWELMRTISLIFCKP